MWFARWHLLCNQFLTIKPTLSTNNSQLNSALSSQLNAFTIEMDRSSANTEVRPKDSAECSARQRATIRPNFGKNSASHLRRFVSAAHVNLKSLYYRL